MIRNIKIANFKSIASQSIPLGRFTVLIGENGAGKSNILEALVMASAASTGRLEREILIGRGMRMTYSQTLPLGTRGEGLAELLIVMLKDEPDRIDEINGGLALLGFCEKVYFSSLANKKIYIKDRYIQRDGILIDQLSLNEGFLFCLFYLTLFTSKYTPQFFAIENIENGLNPKLVEALVGGVPKNFV